MLRLLIGALRFRHDKLIVLQHMPKQAARHQQSSRWMSDKKTAVQTPEEEPHSFSSMRTILPRANCGPIRRDTREAVVLKRDLLAHQGMYQSVMSSKRAKGSTGVQQGCAYATHASYVIRLNTDHDKHYVNLASKGLREPHQLLPAQAEVAG